MSCLNEYKWKIEPERFPKVIRNCPKCGCKTEYINTGKFRVNANKNSLDVWIIFQCKKCKSTWNMSIYERVNPGDIYKDEYIGFLENDEELMRVYAFDERLYGRNKAEVSMDDIGFKVNKSSDWKQGEEDSVIDLSCDFPIKIRMDKFLSENLTLSRSSIKKLIEDGSITVGERNISKGRINPNLNIRISLKKQNL